MYRLLGVAGVLVVSTLAIAHAQASDPKPWLYPCDVWMTSSCIRLPTDMSMTYKVPSDFGLYTVVYRGHDVLSIYVGSAPRVPTGAASLKLSSSDADLAAFRGERNGRQTLDVVITPKKKGMATTHLFATFIGDQKHEVARVASSLRACRRQSREELICPAKGEWGEAISKLLDDSSTEGR